MNLSKRLAELPPYLFVEISRKIAEKRARGEEVISFAIGDPDMATPPQIIEKLCQASKQEGNHHYPETSGLPGLRKAIAEWYKERFEVALDQDTEVVPLIGSKEGIGHVAFCLIDSGDIALVPDPGYPVYAIGTTLAGGQPYYMPLDEKNAFLPDLGKIPEDVARKARVLWLNYPNNPTGATADLGFFDQVVDFARKYEVAVCHDNAYSELYFEGQPPPSFLQAPGAREVGIEFHSFSKSYNMTGWRIGMAVGNSSLINALTTLKSNLDSGIPQAIQEAAITALQSPPEILDRQKQIYRKRRDLIVEVLKDIGLEVNSPKAGLYVWARVPVGYSSFEFVNSLLDQCGVAITPGTGYGKNGEGYVRFSLTVHDANLIKGLSRLSNWKDVRNPFKAKQR